MNEALRSHSMAGSDDAIRLAPLVEGPLADWRDAIWCQLASYGSSKWAWTLAITVSDRLDRGLGNCRLQCATATVTRVLKQELTLHFADWRSGTLPAMCDVESRLMGIVERVIAEIHCLVGLLTHGTEERQ